MRGKSDELFQLIQTLSKSEKRYVSLQMRNRKKQAQLLRVYELFLAQKVYDEAYILEHLAPDVATKQFHVLKHRLLKTILRHLRQYHSARGVKRQLSDYLQDIEWMYEKRLYELCQKYINKALTLAEKHQVPLYSLLILEWKDKLLVRSRYIDKSIRDIQAVQDEFEQHLHAFSTIRSYRDLESQVFYHSYRLLDERTTQEARAALDTLKKVPALASCKLPVPFKARCYYYSIKSLLASVDKNYIQAFTWRKALVEYLDTHTETTSEQLRNHIIACFNTILAAHRIFDFEAVLHYIHKLRIIPTQYKKVRFDARLQYLLFPKSYYLELSTYSLHGQIEQGVLVIAQIKEAINTYNSSTPKSQMLLLYFALAEFLLTASRPEEALDYVYKILEDKAARAMSNLYYNSQMLLLMCQFDLKHYRLLSSLVRSVERQLRTLQRYQDCEKHFLRLFRKAEDVVQTKDFKQLLSDVFTHIAPYRPRPRQAVELDFWTWIEAHLHNQSLAEAKKARIPEVYKE